MPKKTLMTTEKVYPLKNNSERVEPIPNATHKIKKSRRLSFFSTRTPTTADRPAKA
jgi:hypothetical protein